MSFQLINTKKTLTITLIIQIQLFGQKRRLLEKATSNFIFGQKFSVSDVVGI